MAMVKANSLFSGFCNPFASAIIYKSRNKLVKLEPKNEGDVESTLRPSINTP